jgi:hypothetical protein
MANNGIVKLLDKSGELVRAVTYHGSRHRKEIVSSWCKLYKGELTIQICPTEICERVKEDGTNKRGKRLNGKPQLAAP